MQNKNDKSRYNELLAAISDVSSACDKIMYYMYNVNHQADPKIIVDLVFEKLKPQTIPEWCVNKIQSEARAFSSVFMTTIIDDKYMNVFRGDIKNADISLDEIRNKAQLKLTNKNGESESVMFLKLFHNTVLMHLHVIVGALFDIEKQIYEQEYKLMFECLKSLCQQILVTQYDLGTLFREYKNLFAANNEDFENIENFINMLMVELNRLFTFMFYQSLKLPDMNSFKDLSNNMVSSSAFQDVSEIQPFNKATNVMKKGKQRILPL